MGKIQPRAVFSCSITCLKILSGAGVQVTSAFQTGIAPLFLEEDLAAVCTALA
jgi:hypothetical protein